MCLGCLSDIANKIVSSALFSLLLLSSAAFAATPQFSSYKIDDIYAAKNAPLVNSETAGAQWKDLRRAAAKQPVNFAGHYILFTGDCGGASVCGEVINAKTGVVVRSLPNAYLAYNEDTEESFDIDYKVDSKLIIITGLAQDGEVGVDKLPVSRVYRTRYYSFDGRDFNMIFSEDN